MVICGPQKFQMAPKKIERGPNMALKITDLGTTLSLHRRMYYLPKFEAYIKRSDPQFQWWDPDHIQSWVPRTPKHSTWCKTLYLWLAVANHYATVCYKKTLGQTLGTCGAKHCMDRALCGAFCVFAWNVYHCKTGSFRKAPAWGIFAISVKKTLQCLMQMWPNDDTYRKKGPGSTQNPCHW